MKESLEKKVALVTGGARGYGSGIAAALRERGAQVWITGRDETSLNETAAQLGVEALRADVTSAADWDRVFEKLEGRLDILVNNAGWGGSIVPLEEQDDDTIHEVLATNLTGVVLGCRRAIPCMKQQGGGSIVNISSACQQYAWPGWSVYSAAKAGLAMLGRCLHAELREHNIRVTTIVPAWGATNFRDAAGMEHADAETTAKMIQPQDIGGVVAELCELPPHLVVPELTLLPMVQEIVPF